MPPPVAVIVSGKVPLGVLEEVETVNVDSAGPPRIVVGKDAPKGFVGSAVLKAPVAPAGNPLTLKLIWPANPFTGVTQTEYG